MVFKRGCPDKGVSCTEYIFVMNTAGFLEGGGAFKGHYCIHMLQDTQAKWTLLAWINTWVVTHRITPWKHQEMGF